MTFSHSADYDLRTGEHLLQRIPLRPILHEKALGVCLSKCIADIGEYMAREMMTR